MNEIPQGKLRRSTIGGKTAARVGGKLIGFYAKRPFLSEDNKHRAREQMEEESAAIVFETLSLLKGTAIKIGQMLSFEMDMLPEPICKELSKSYNQIPPMNQALVLKMIRNAFNSPVENVFKSFETQAFAAASLGQVHRAEALDGTPLAVKVQYPGIGASVKSDMQMVGQILRPLSDYYTILPVLEEIEQRLSEEIDYNKEADNIDWFADRMPENGFFIPDVIKDLSTDTVLSMTFLEGLPLNEWLKTGPDQDAIDTVAQRLNDWFKYCFYDLHCIHADPNPGNFIIDDDLNLGIVDFGCVRHFEAAFVEKYRNLIKALIAGDRDAHMGMLREFDLINDDVDSSSSVLLNEILSRFGDWYGKLLAKPVFDFGANSDFMKEAKAISHDFKKIRRYVKLNPNFVYLDRTQYGMWRLFEQMGARVRFRTTSEN